MKRFFTGVFIVLIPLALAAQHTTTAPQGIERLKSQISSVIRRVDKNFGIAVKHLESDQELQINGDDFFPMASVFKVPVVVEVMAQILEGRFSLDDEISVQKTDQHLGSGMLSDLDAPGITLSVRNLINMMLKISDNSATDLLVTKVGPENVNTRMKSFGIENMTVDRTCQDLILEAIGLKPENYRGLSLEEVQVMRRKEMAENPAAFEEATKTFSQVLKDQSTPLAMNLLLEKIFNKEILDSQSCEHIISVLLQCQTGQRRIKGDIPSGVRVAHKTGTIGGTVNDVGIIYLPDELGHVVLTIFTKDTEDDTSDVEDLIAQISRFVFDYFYFTVE